VHDMNSHAHTVSASSPAIKPWTGSWQYLPIATLPLRLRSASYRKTTGGLPGSTAADRIVANLSRATPGSPRDGDHTTAQQSHSPAAQQSSGVPRGVCGHSDKHATRKFPAAQCAFKIWMIHEVLQFALRIAFRCVLHRCGNLDIRC